MEYKRLTKRRKDGSVALDFYSNSKDFTIVELKLRLAELEDKIEAGKLVFIDEPFYSEERQCWGVYQKSGDIVQTLFMTEEQAKDYKKFRGINERI